MSKQTDFDELHMALKEEALTIIDKPTDKSKKDKISNKCPHENTLLDHGLKVMVCTECFIAIVDDSGSFTGASSSFARCFARKVSDKGIYNDVIGYGFPNNIIFEANRIYSHVTKGKTCRANNRQGLVFACVFHAFQNSGEPKSFDYINKKFNLQQKVISKGVKRVGLSMAGLNIKNTYITATNLNPEIMNMFNATPTQIGEVIAMYSFIDGKSVLLTRSKPQSVACGVVFYYIQSTGRKITIDDFTSKVKLSELTINKIMKEIHRIVENEDVPSKRKSTMEDTSTLNKSPIVKKLI